jgi:hypothetical protein
LEARFHYYPIRTGNESRDKHLPGTSERNIASEYISFWAWLLEVIFPSYPRLIESFDVKLPGTSKREIASEYISFWAWLLEAHFWSFLRHSVMYSVR